MNAIQEYEFHGVRRDMERVQELSHRGVLVHFHVMKGTAVFFARHEALQGSVKSDLYSHRRLPLSLKTYLSSQMEGVSTLLMLGMMDLRESEDN